LRHPLQVALDHDGVPVLPEDQERAGRRVEPDLCVVLDRADTDPVEKLEGDRENA
jgi:hypothetical protein